MTRSPMRSSLHRVASLTQDVQPLSEHDKRELGRRLWRDHRTLVVFSGWVPSIIWDACVAIGNRLYGERRT